MRRILFVAVVLFFTVAPLVMAQGTISGTVTDSAQQPLPCRVAFFDGTWEWLAEVTCDINGHYQSLELDAGSYYVMALVEESPQYVPQFWQSTFFEDEAEPVLIENGQETTGIDFELVPGGSISGTIRDHLSGAPIAEAFVEFFEKDWRYYRPTESDEDGRYLIQGLPPSTVNGYALLPDSRYIDQYWDHVFDEDEATGIDIRGTEAHENVDFDLFLEAVLTGQVIDVATSLPIADAYVEAITEDYVSRFTWTLADGSFRIGLIRPGSYLLWADADGYEMAYYADEQGSPIEVTLGEAQETGGLTIALARGGAISGRLVHAADDTPVAFGYASAEATDGSSWGGADADENGVYRIEGLPAGNYWVTGQGNATDNLIPQLYSDANGQPIAINVIVGEEVPDIEFSLHEGAIISGLVTASGTGAALENIYISAEEIDGQVWRDAVTGPAGEYSINGLSEGDYIVESYHPDFVHQAYDGAFLHRNATPVQPRIGTPVEGIDFVLDWAGAISGTVRDAQSGEALAGIYVEAFFNQDTWVPGAWAETGEDGSYTLFSVPPDESMYVVAYDDNGAYAWQWSFGASLFANAAPVPVTAGETTAGIDFALFEAGRITFSPSTFEFTGMTYQDDIPSQDLTITNHGPGPVIVDAWGDSDWLTVNYEGNLIVLQANESLTAAVSASPWGMAPGEYTDPIVVYNLYTDSETEIPVSFDLAESPPLLELEPRDLWFDTESGVGTPAAETLYMANVGGGEISFQITSAASWLTISPTSGTLLPGNEAFEIGVDAATEGLAEGEHSAEILVESSIGAFSVDVELYVAPPAEGETIIQAPESIIILIPGGLPLAEQKLQASKSFEIRNDGAGTLYWNARFTDQWIDVQPRSGSIPPGGDPVAMTLTADPEQLRNGMNSSYLEFGSSQERWITEVGVQIGSLINAQDRVDPAAKGQLVVPVLIHAEGENNSEFVSDLWIAHRPTGQSTTVSLAFVPEGSDGTQRALTSILHLGSGETISLLDVMDNWLGGLLSKGALVIQSDDIEDVETSSRTYNNSKSGSYGQDIGGVPSSEGITRLDDRLFIPGLANSANTEEGYRSNILLTELAGEESTAVIELYDSHGILLGSLQRSVSPFSTTQINRIFDKIGFTDSLAGARAEIEVISGDGRLTALGSVVDNVTNDPTTIMGVPKDASISQTIVPVVANSPGVAGTQWISDVAIANVDSAQRQISIQYNDSKGRLIDTFEDALQPGHTMLLSDIVGSTFGRSSSRGSLAITADPVGGLVITSRTFNQSGTGTYGQGIAGRDAAKALNRDSGVLRIIALNNTERYRTNLGITEVTGHAATVGIVLIARDGVDVLGSIEVELDPREQYQPNIFEIMGLANSQVYAATAYIQVIDGEGAIMAYGSTVDNESGDGTTLPPPERLPEGDLANLSGGQNTGTGGSPRP